MHDSYHLTFFTQIRAFFSITMSWCVFRTISNIYDETVNYFHDKKNIYIYLAGSNIRHCNVLWVRVLTCSSVPIVKFEHVIAGWDVYVCIFLNLLIDYNTIHVLPFGQGN